MQPYEQLSSRGPKTRPATRIRNATPLTLAALLLAASAGSAWAQSQSTSSSSGGLETVTVTAQYFAQSMQTAPLAISALTSSDLEQRGLNDLSQVGTSIPNLTLTKAPAAFGSALQIYIRGVGQYDSSFAAEPGVGTYIDGVYYGTMFGTVFDLLDLQRIEVLKGPQGVLGGKNNIGGAIKLVTQKPQGDDSGYFQASYGSFNKFDVKGMFDVSIIPNHLFMRFSAMSRRQDGYVNVIDYACANPSARGGPTAAYPNAKPLPILSTQTNCKLGTQGGTNVVAARVALRAIINPRIQDNFEIDVTRDNSEPQADVLFAADSGNGNVYFNRNGSVQSVTRAQFFGLNSNGAVSSTSMIPAWNTAYNLPHYGIPWDQRFIAKDPYTTTYGTYTSQQGQRYTQGAMVHDWGMSNVLDWDVTPNIHVKSISGFRIYKAANSNDSDVSPMSFQLTTSYPTDRELQQEIRVTGSSFDHKLEWTAGVFYYHRKNRETGPVILDAFYDTGAPFLVTEQNHTYVTTNKSAYLHLIYHVFDNLEIFGGVRYTKESKTFYYDASAAVPGYPGSGFFRSTVNPAYDCNVFIGHVCDHSIHPALLGHTSRTARPDWRGGVDYHFTKNIMAYVQYTTGYRTGGTNARPFAPDQLDSYGPEELKSWEVGAKTELFHHRLRFNVALFHGDYTNTITPLSETDTSLGFPLPYVKYVNLGSSTNKGFELEATAAPLDNLLMDASFSYVEVNASPLPGAPTGWEDGCSAAGVASGACPQVAAGTVRVGTNPILFPKETAHFDIQYLFDMGNGGTLTPRLDYNWQSTIYQDANNNPYTEVKPRGLLNARLTWNSERSGWQLAFAVSNLTDKRYFLDMSNFAIFGEGTVESNFAAFGVDDRISVLFQVENQSAGDARFVFHQKNKRLHVGSSGAPL